MSKKKGHYYPTESDIDVQRVVLFDRLYAASTSELRAQLDGYVTDSIARMRERSNERGHGAPKYGQASAKELVIAMLEMTCPELIERVRKMVEA